jgi:hypothetical protein
MDRDPGVSPEEKELTQRLLESIFSDPFAASISCIPRG